MGAGATAAAPTSYNQFVTIDVTAVPSSPSCMAMATFYWSVYRSVKCPSLRHIYIYISCLVASFYSVHTPSVTETYVILPLPAFRRYGFPRLTFARQDL